MTFFGLCVKTFEAISATGLVFDIIGVVVLFKYGVSPNAQKYDEGSYSTSPQAVEEGKALNVRFHRIALIGLIIMVVGFILQLIGVIFKN